MPQKIITYTAAFLVLLFGFFSWFSIDRAVYVNNASDFAFPALFFSLYAISLGLFIVFTKEKFFFSIVAALSLFGSLVFAENIFHSIFVLLGFVLILVGRIFVRRDLQNNIKINIFKSLGTGFYEIVLALAIIICSQYFFSISKLSAGELVPKFESNKITSEMISFSLGRINPQFEKIEDENLTVDQFLGDMYMTLLEKQKDETKRKIEERKTELGNIGEDQVQIEVMFEELPEGTRSEIIETWKGELSKLAGYELVGSEKVIDIMIALINNKTVEIAGSMAEGDSGINKVALVFAIGLFLALVPTGSFLSRIWILIVWLIFSILLRAGVMKIEKRTVEAQSIA